MKLQNHKQISITVITLLFLSVFGIQANAQSVVYSYDNNGNRVDPRLVTNNQYRKPKNNDTTKVTVYPNPATSQINVSISTLKTCGHATVYLLDASANIISTQEATQSPLVMDISNYAQGEYYVRVVMCNNQYTNKVVKTTPGTGTPTIPTMPRPAVTK